MERVSLTFSPHRILSHVAMVTEVLPMIRLVCAMETVREATNDKRRFTHYLSHSTIAASDLKHNPILDL